MLSKKTKQPNTVDVRMTFYDSISQMHNDTRLQHERRRILLPGLYAAHLEKWLSVYPAKQVGTSPENHEIEP